MAKLTDTQLSELSKAARRADGITVEPSTMKRAWAAKVGISLVVRKLMREIRSKPGLSVWREDDRDRSISLILTRAGRDAIEDAENACSVAPTGTERIELDRPVEQKSREARRIALKESRAESIDAASLHAAIAAPRAGTKQALVIDMLSKGDGATLDALVEATGWLPHTTRAALTGLRKRGFRVELRRADGKQASTYRIPSIAQNTA